jgi:hypothetical protein
MRDNTNLDVAIGPKMTGFTAMGVFLFFGAFLWQGTVLDRAWTLNPTAYKQLAPLYEAASNARLDAYYRDSYGPTSILGDPLFYRVDVILPCAEGTLDLSNLLICAAVGSATGLLIGIALIAARRKSLGQFADSHG